MNSINLKSVQVSDPHAFQNLLQQKSQALLEELDVWISTHEANTNETASAEHRQVNVGIYYYEEFSGGVNNEQIRS